MHVGTTNVIFGYNGRDGVITDRNGLIYMRARYYSPQMRRFINADVLHGAISDSTSLNRYSYVNGNPVSFVDPFGLLGIVALMLIGAGVGVVISGVGSVIGQKLESESDGEEFKLDIAQTVSNTVWGAVDGAIAFSPLGPVEIAVGGVITSVGCSLTDEFIDDEAGVNITRMGKSIAYDLALGMIDLDFTNGKNISKALKSTNEAIETLNKRQNRKWAEKQIARLKAGFNSLLSDKIFEEFFNGLTDIGLSSKLNEFDNWLDTYINLPDYMDKGIVNGRK